MATRRRKSSSSCPAIGSCFAVAVDERRYAACQVIAEHGSDQVEVIALDWLGGHPPTLAELADARVLILTHHNWEGRPERCIVPAEPPPEFIALGVCEPLARFDEDCRSYGSWEGVASQVPAQRWWDEEAPKPEVAAFELARRHPREPVAVELGGRRHELVRGTSKVRIGPSEALAAEPDASLDWAALDVLGRLTSIEYEGRDPAVAGYVSRRALIGELCWRGHGQARIDLSRARLRRLELELGAEPLVLALSGEIEAVALLGYRGQALRIEHPHAGRGLELSLFDVRDAPPRAIPGVPRLSSLVLGKPRVVDLAALGYPGLESLDLHFDAGRLEHLEALRELGELRSLELHDVYDMDPEQLPTPAELPRLESVEIHGLRKAHAAVLKSRLAGLARLELRGAKTDAWLAANAHNPFNNWVDESAAFGRAACKVYKQTLARIAKLDGDGREALHAELLAFVQAFNRIDAKHGLDTIHREHIYDVFHALAAESPFEIEAAVLDEWFDEDREF